MAECGVSLQIFPGAILPTASWPWTVTLTPPTFRNRVGRCSRDGLVGVTLTSRDYVWIFDASVRYGRIQVFHCLKHEGTGGRTLLVDGFYAAEKLRQSSPERFELLAQVPVKHDYIENTDRHQNHMTGIGPVLNVYPWNNEMYLIRYVDAEI